MDLGRRLRDKEGDLRSEFYLMQTLSITVRRGNAAGVMGTFRPGQIRAGTEEPTMCSSTSAVPRSACVDFEVSTAAPGGASYCPGRRHCCDYVRIRLHILGFGTSATRKAPWWLYAFLKSLEAHVTDGKKTHTRSSPSPGFGGDFVTTVRFLCRDFEQNCHLSKAEETFSEAGVFNTAPLPCRRYVFGLYTRFIRMEIQV
ncbi:hypothetical protein EVAR_20139_1 [Eumeta japonica]|uniref:Uncharacterized protein n=1 Tax=Eumeta variegata TaxID=151549 RepID=A0A4C1V335_EUMVA|nr:hypothetical protein EVAR_20139_1 [Eumeta japonica]